MEIHQIPLLRNPVMIMAFSGWNDAAEAASGAVEHLLSGWGDRNDEVLPELIADVESEEFYDFQVNRPVISIDESEIRSITWPTTQIFGLSIPTMPRDLVVVTGVEPSMRWKSFTSELLDLADDLEVSLIVTLGSLLADTPHTRPITVTGTGAHPSIATRLGVSVSKYEGPTGILGVIQDGCMRRGIDAISLWAAVPHYASNAPSPKATLALINTLEDFLDISIPLSDLEENADAWEKEVNDLAAEDTEVAEYVKALEESKDAAELPDVSGDSIAKEFERYLRRHKED
ncbi:MAG: carboxylate--amine ligase [Actinobacteria bacterium BACL15 MAG-120619-bin91]|uniref:Carboxylate--amine ligase n=1 Tax=Actinobacteria bacterium BACL15 MAG-120619-bin91 TaxID=1655562 RepID=A0A0R2PJN2_9ACTN|nr:MAG: carboxylate--amine ligase [Actinobacteria bacterium BACL15 MAG-120619-bin91]